MTPGITYYIIRNSVQHWYTILAMRSLPFSFAHYVLIKRLPNIYKTPFNFLVLSLHLKGIMLIFILFYQ